MPPARPEFCYYEALGVEKTATQQEIVSAYRSLARIHHPDKNPNDENATARFQRIQAAHETLSDTAKRQRYDNLVANPPGLRSSSNNANQAYYHEDDYGFDDDEDDDDEGFQFFFGFGGFHFHTGGGGGFGGFRPPSYEEMERRFREAEAFEREHRIQEEKRRKEALKSALADQLAVREAQEEARRQKEAQKKLEEERSKQALEKRKKDERTAQEKRWTELGASTDEEKRNTCLHSAFCTKIKLQKKCKCGACGQKRGGCAFQCPHCDLMSCQLCLTKFQEKRQRHGRTG